MATGWAAGSSICYASQADAANALCASAAVNGCQSPAAASGSPGPNGSQPWTFTYTPASAPVVMSLQPCDRFDFTTYQPILGAGIALLVAVVCAKAVQRMFYTHA